MKVAFVGKGGSGKSTIASLFIRLLDSDNKTILAIDGDINIHLAELLGANINNVKALSLPNNSNDIRKYLRGSNKRIVSSEHFVKTTPPGNGSNFLEIKPDNFLVKNYAEHIDNNLFFMHVGTYEPEGIGVSCYHTNLTILENILSHSKDGSDWLVCDMVAGTDAFSGSLHAQFDLIALIVEPTPEGIKVFEQYQELAKAAGVLDYVIVIGNKVEDQADIEYLQKAIGDKLFGTLPAQKNLRRARQEGKTPDLNDIDGLVVLENLMNYAEAHKRSPETGLSLLHNLHRKHAREQYIVDALGDVTNQIDPDFSYGKE